MKNFFHKGRKIFGLKELPTDVVIYRVLPHFFLELIKKYLRLDTQGLENIPRTGPAIIAANHSGFSGFDAILLGYEINRSLKRTTRIMTHHLWFFNQNINIPANKLGFYEATRDNLQDFLGAGKLVSIFPEGEHGNFKPSSEKYQLQPFKRGFIRAALEKKCPIIPTIVIGAEETHINLATLKFSKYIKNLILPLPVNLVPLPAKWKIIFLEPVHLPYHQDASNDSALVHEIASDIRDKMQNAINAELAKREYVYIRGVY